MQLSLSSCIRDGEARLYKMFFGFMNSLYAVTSCTTVCPALDTQGIAILKYD